MLPALVIATHLFANEKTVDAEILLTSFIKASNN
jgi:hypothetical protein